MEQTTLNQAILSPSPTSQESEPNLSLRGLANAKPWAHGRRRSLFDLQRRTNDIGNALLSHADFPKVRARSVSSLHHDKNNTFEKQAAYKVLEQVINMELSFTRYDAKECAASSHKIATLVKEKICNTFDLPGCKVISLCYITKRAKPSIAIDSGCAWDERKTLVDKDAFVDYVYKNETIVAVASVFVIHCQRADLEKTGMEVFQLPNPSPPKARSRTFSEPPILRKDSGIFLPLPKRDDWMI